MHGILVSQLFSTGFDGSMTGLDNSLHVKGAHIRLSLSSSLSFEAESTFNSTELDLD